MRVPPLFLLLLATALFAADYRVALPGYEYEFPRDHFNHPQFQTEWWYYTGNLFTPQGRRFGFELTFFRQATGRSGDTSVWSLDDIYLAHLALSDLENSEFQHSERLNRAGPGLAGADFAERLIWNGNWSVKWQGSRQSLEAVTERFTLRLTLDPLKPPVIHGENGVSQKAAGKGRASHYISFSRLRASGTILLDGETFALDGLSWMDHEFFTNSMSPEQVGWDWFSVQLDDGSDLMFYRLRLKNGSVEPYSHGTFVAADGATRSLKSSEFELLPGRKWKNYPVEWSIRVPSLDLSLEAVPLMDAQELTSNNDVSPTYWEGAMDFTGSHAGAPVGGYGYLEMTGYAAPFTLGQKDEP